MYSNVNVKISDNQKNKIQKAIKNQTEVTIRIDPRDEGDDLLALTNTQIKKLNKNKPANITLSKTQLKHNMKIEGGFLPLLAAAASRILPMVTSKILPTVAKSLGVGALSGLASTGVNKIFGDGLYLSKGGKCCSIETKGDGLYLTPYNNIPIKGDGLFLSKGGEIYDGSGIVHEITKDIPILNLLF